MFYLHAEAHVVQASHRALGNPYSLSLRFFDVTNVLVESDGPIRILVFIRDNYRPNKTGALSELLLVSRALILLPVMTV